ncbi:hypothetical protein SAMN04488515_0648 [Cognatiyoonia koreensis]|uniref:Uncharacterized protein n=1 Tax=Cognatiyoonia koreensis TaxID=364200 RepID=A0A1I0NIV6_9RHOB|nr:hypothetical protein [Cognatiyoonia koreensis]SEW01374.1 hypothetical protein SAMN04488515_0648 [Cognatiyoonia koreensis]
MKTQLLAAILAATATFAALPASAQQTAITENFAGGELNWDGPARTQIRWAPVPSNGEILICGAYSNIGGTKITRLSRVVMQQSKVVDVNGNTVLNTLSFFNNISSAHYQSKLMGQMANCRSTGRPATQAELSGLRLDVKTGRIRTP